MRTPRRGPRLAGALAAVLVTVGCASSGTLRRVAVASEQFAAGTERVQLLVMDLHQRKLMTDGDYRAWQLMFGRLAVTGLAINAAVRASDGATAAAQIRAAVALVDELLAKDVIRLPVDARVTVTIALESVRAVLVALSVGVEEEG